MKIPISWKSRRGEEVRSKEKDKDFKFPRDRGNQDKISHSDSLRAIQDHKFDGKSGIN